MGVWFYICFVNINKILFFLEKFLIDTCALRAHAHTHIHTVTGRIHICSLLSRASTMDSHLSPIYSAAHSHSLGMQWRVSQELFFAGSPSPPSVLC